MAASLAAILILEVFEPAVCAHAQAAGPFETVPMPVRSSTSGHRAAYLTIGAGLGLVGVSFALRRRANGRYAEYLAGTDPDEIVRLYGQTVSLDRWSAAALIGGELVVAGGVYLRFLRPTSRVRLAVTPSRCAVSLRF
jgi:hypothetical protein